MPSAARWWWTSAPAPAARRWRSALRCATPGRLYAFDTSAHRLDALKPRLARSKLSNVHPAAIAHERDERIKRLAGKIDRVIVDAPCSGLGTLRRNPDLKWRQSPQSVQEMTVKQAAILHSAARLLKPGGRLVYATCSLLPQENEAIAQAFSQAHPDFTPLAGRRSAVAAEGRGRRQPVQWRRGRRGFPAAVAAPPSHRRFLCRLLDEKLTMSAACGRDMWMTALHD